MDDWEETPVLHDKTAAASQNPWKGYNAVRHSVYDDWWRPFRLMFDVCWNGSVTLFFSFPFCVPRVMQTE